MNWKLETLYFAKVDIASQELQKQNHEDYNFEIQDLLLEVEKRLAQILFLNELQIK